MRKTIADVREERGKAIARVDGHVKRIDENYYKVRSQSGNGEYDVRSGELGWICSCPDFAYRGQKCKHIHAVEFSLVLRKKVASQIVIRPVSDLSCPSCQSDAIVRHGIRHNKYGDLQRFSCKECMKRFTFNIGFEGMRSTPQVITSAMQLYFTGESFRNVQKFLRLQGVRVSHMAVYKWIKKYVSLMQQYLEGIRPDVSDVWRADELYVKIRGNMKYLYALMDDETRFWMHNRCPIQRIQAMSDHCFKEEKRSQRVNQAC
jgi:putative transposase